MLAPAMLLPPLLLLLLVPQPAAAAAPSPDMFHSILLNDPDPEGARCLDGTPPRIWLHLAEPGSPNRSKWAWHFQVTLVALPPLRSRHQPLSPIVAAG
jgi:hypothetical protein